MKARSTSRGDESGHDGGQHDGGQDRGTGRGTGRDAGRTAARWYSLLVVVYVGFIAAATLSVDVGTPSWDRGLDKLAGFARASAVQFETVHDLRDIATNVLLFLPLGALVALRRGALQRGPWSAWLVLGSAVSVTLEIAQAFTDRSPDPIDVLTNSGGYLLGYALVFLVIRRFGLRPQVLLGLSAVHHDEKVRTVAGVLFLYVCVYAVLQLVPFDITVSLGRIHAKLMATGDAPRIILDPLFHFRQGGDSVLKLIYAALGVIPAAALKAHLDALRGRQSFLVTIWFGTVLGTGLELMQIFVVSRTVDVACVLLAPIAAAMGWVLAWGWERIQGLHNVHDPARGGHGGHERLYGLGLAALVYLGILMALAWAPFDVEPDLRVVAQKVRDESNVVPFRLHFELHSLHATRDIIEETVQFVPLGLMVVLFCRQLGARVARFARMARMNLRAMMPVAAAVCALVGLFLELGQAFFRGRVIDFTDVLLAGLGGLLGSALVRVLAQGRLARSLTSPPVSPRE
jgi:glycopeptide antibiotics resistance protein